MEATLIAAADNGVELRHPLFARWFAAWPERRATFLNADAASRRMTDETLEMMLGLAKCGSVNSATTCKGELAGAAWSAEAQAAWRRQGERLKVLIIAARKGWDEAMPGHILEELSKAS